MTPFIRFILTVVIAGIVVNLAVVLLANVQSQQRELKETAAAKTAFKHDVLDNVNDHLRRLDIVVESQLSDPDGCVQSTLLLRQYASTGRDTGHPLPVHRIVIPGRSVSVEGVVLEFDSLFAKDAEDFRVLCPDLGRQSRLAYFAQVWGSGALDREGKTATSEERFTLLPPNSVPELTRIDPDVQAPTRFERRLWIYLWGLINQHPSDDEPRPLLRQVDGLSITWTKPISRDVYLNQTYTVFVYPNGQISIEEDPDTALREAIRNEAKARKFAEEMTGTPFN